MNYFNSESPTTESEKQLIKVKVKKESPPDWRALTFKNNLLSMTDYSARSNMRETLVSLTPSKETGTTKVMTSSVSS